VGYKTLYELYDPEVLDRMRKERRETVWNPGHNYCMLIAVQKLSEFRRQQSGKPPEDCSVLPELERQNYEAEVAVSTEFVAKCWCADLSVLI